MTRGVPTVKERRDLIELVAEHGAGAMDFPADLGDWRDYMLQALACDATAVAERVARLEADNAQLRALLRLVGSMFDSDLLLAKPLGESVEQDAEVRA